MIADGPLLERLSASLAEIIAALEKDPGDDPWTALLFAAVGRMDIAETIVDRAIASTAEGVHSPALFGGFTGVAWTITHLFSEPNEEIDNALAVMLDEPSLSASYDLINGLVGFGVYFLEQLSLPQARDRAAASLERIVVRLEERALHTESGMTWHTAPELLPDWQRKLAPRGYYNLGLAHGVPGIIALVSRVCEANIGGPRARALLDGAVEWLLASASAEAPSRFTNWIALGEDEVGDGPSRIAWCYGDLGIAAALLVAARCTGEDRWEREAIALAESAAIRRGPDALVVDASLCHGAAGIAHIFHRLHRATGVELFRETSLHWFEWTLQHRSEGGIAGYRAWRGPGAGEDFRGFLEGAAGIGLALSAATSDVEPAWDRLLLI